MYRHIEVAMLAAMAQGIVAMDNDLVYDLKINILYWLNDIYSIFSDRPFISSVQDLSVTTHPFKCMWMLIPIHYEDISFAL